MGARGYPAEFRRRVLDLVEGGRKVADVAADLGISGQTIYNWRRQDRIDRGLEDGLTSEQRGELASAKRRIAELEDVRCIDQGDTHVAGAAPHRLRQRVAGEDVHDFRALDTVALDRRPPQTRRRVCW